jgi:hypothetical protein
MATTIKSTDLDFDTIKARLKDYLKSQDEFSDYNFEASGISNVLDVLAYNTHFNGLIANFALNESFLNTAQLRSSVVSHAEALGYVPRSYTSAKGLLNIALTINLTNRPTSITLPANTKFSTEVNSVSYTFQTLEKYTAVDDGSGFYQFLTNQGSEDIPIYEGTMKTKTFFVGETSEEQIYVLSDITMDTSSLNVKVYDTASGNSYTSYTNLRDAVKIDTTSTHYQIKEVPNGNYELLFGDGVTTGKKPSAGNKIVVEYLSTKAMEANGATSFTANADLTINDVDYPLAVTVSSESSGGAYKESIDSIRRNAPIGFASQQRLVTAEDYKAQILARYNNYLTDVIAWGGMDNDPPKYGAVYVSLNFKDGVSADIQQDVKDQIVGDLTSNISVMSIDTLFTDAITTFLELTTFFNLDPDLTNSTPLAVANDIDELIQTFFNNNLKNFGKVFRRSQLLADIDELDEAILNSRMDVKVQQRFTPSIGQSLSYTLQFPVALANPDDEFYRITSNRFVFNNLSCIIRNKLKSNKLEVVDIEGNIQVDNIGSYTPETGTVNIVGFNPTSIEGTSQVKISAVPTNQSTVRPLRNYILNIDTTNSITSAQIDYQETRLTL